MENLLLVEGRSSKIDRTRAECLRYANVDEQKNQSRREIPRLNYFADDQIHNIPQ